MLDQCGRKAGVGDDAAVGATVAETERGVRVLEHLLHEREVARSVVEQRVVDQRTTVVVEERVVGDLLRCAPLRLGEAGEGLLGSGLVVGRFPEAIHLVPAAHDLADQPVGDRRLLRQERLAHLGFAHLRHPLVERHRVEPPVRRMEGERVQCGGEAEEHAGRPGRHLPAHREAVGLCSRHRVEELHPPFGAGILLLDRDRTRAARRLGHARNIRNSSSKS